MNVETREVFAVIGNTDCTEGRGDNFVKAYCETLATAKRLGRKGYVQGGDCPVERRRLYKVDDGYSWLGPVKIEKPTKEDQTNQAKLDEVQNALNAAYAAGLSEDQIRLLKLA